MATKYTSGKGVWRRLSPLKTRGRIKKTSTVTAENLPVPQREKKEWRVVAHRRDVVGVGASERVRSVAGNQIRKWIGACLGGQVKGFELRILAEVLGDGRLFVGGEGRLFRQHDHGDAILVERAFGSDDEVARRAGDAQPVQGFHGEGDDAQGFPRMVELPARDGDHSVGLEVLEILAEGLDGVQIVFAQGKGSGCS